MKFNKLSLTAFLLLLSIAAFAMPAADSIGDWEAAPKGKAPDQGFRNWEFGYYQKRNTPASFTRIQTRGKSCWGDGNYTYGAIFKDEMCWSSHKEKFNVVRRWNVPADGSYHLILEGKHALKVNGREVSWGRKLTVFVNDAAKQVITFPGQKVLKKELDLELKKGDRLDFAAHEGGSSLKIAIRIENKSAVPAAPPVPPAAMKAAVSAVQISADSVKDWEAAPKGKAPAQGFRNWEFGYYQKRNTPASFTRIQTRAKSCWGDGNYTYGAIFKDEMCWSSHKEKFNVVRRWNVPADGSYHLILEGRHALKVNGKEVSWGRKLTVFVNDAVQQVITFPGQKFLTKEMDLELKKGDRLDFAAHEGGSSLKIAIRIEKKNSVDDFSGSRRAALPEASSGSRESSPQPAGLSETVAHSRYDWDAAGKNKVPAQGFRNWEFGYYQKRNTPASFTKMKQHGSSCWGDGNYTCGAIYRDEICWSTHKEKFNVVRRWNVPEDSSYHLILEGKHALKINGKEVSWGRKLTVFVNDAVKQVITFPGQKFLTKELDLELKKGDKLDFAAHEGGSSLQISIRITRRKKALAIIRNGQSPYSIVISRNDPGKVGRRAAVLLQRILRESSGAVLPILTDDQFKGGGPAIHIGRTAGAMKAGIIPADMKEEEYIKRLAGGDLFLCGVNRMTDTNVPQCRFGRHWRPGDYKAVVSFLEQELGARFLLPGPEGEYIPVRKDFYISEDLNIRRCPPFPYHVSSFEIMNHRENYEPYITAINSIDAYDMADFYGHSHSCALSAAEYGKTHPEYFILRGGKRQPGLQLCLSNPQVQKILQEHIEYYFSRGFKYYQLNQSDGFAFCECANCRASGSASRLLWDLHTALAARIYKKYPDCKIYILAYGPTQEPPAHIRSFPPNIIIELSKYDEAEFKKWERFHVPFMVYDYNWGSFNETGFLPKRTPVRLAEQLKRFKKYGVINIFNCGFHNMNTALDAPAGYAYGRLLDDLSLNPDSLLQDYCRTAFGEAAAPLMISFFNAMYKPLNSLPENAYFTEDDPYLIRTPEALSTTHFPPDALYFMEEQLQKAEQLNLDSRSRKNLRHVRLHFNYVRSVIKAFSAYRLFQLEPVRPVFQIICDALQEREQAIDAIFNAGLPKFVLMGYDSREAMLRGGVLIGKLGAPFTWNYRDMLKKGILPILKNKTARSIRVQEVPRMDSPVWQTIPENILDRVSGGRAPLRASFKAAWDDRNLYFLFQTDSPNLAARKLLPAGRESYIVDENFDFFLNPTGILGNYFQYIFSPADNSYLDGNMNIGKHGADPSWNKLDRNWNGGWTYVYKLHPEKNQWTALLTIPVESLHGFTPAPGKFLTMNAGRVCGRELLLWSPNPEAQLFSNPRVFGLLQFEKEL